MTEASGCFRNVSGQSAVSKVGGWEEGGVAFEPKDVKG